ncbi:MAG: manganese/iron transport system substrate-binding protein [Chloroflexi bacterium]|jgi:manganese/iron transport system substrate-binding protein|nr:MAG: manganese/iron transport system substrate-binding protein [Chloroflexota bacterium]
MYRSLVFLMGLLGLLAACGTSPSPPSPSSALKVVTTVSPITSIVESIGGNRVALEGIVPEGVNSHTFSPSPSVARVLAEADLIVLNGLFLEEPSLELAQTNKKAETVILALGDQTIDSDEWKFDFSFPSSQGRPNPHLWPNPMLALRYAELVQEQLTALDPSNAEYYAANLEAFRMRIEELDRGIAASVATVPVQHRKLLTYHDSWAYFADRYGMEVVGAVQPSGFSQPSSREVARLIDQIRDLGLPAVFGSEVFPSDVLEQIAKESGAIFIDGLRDDDLPGSLGEPRHSYLGLMLANMETMIAALGGNTSALAYFDVGPVFEGASNAVYPQ